MGTLPAKLDKNSWTRFRVVRSAFKVFSIAINHIRTPHRHAIGKNCRSRDVRPVVSLSRARGRAGEGAACEATFICTICTIRHFERSGEISCPPAISFARSP